MEKKYARLAALLAAAVLCGNGAPSMAAELAGNKDNGWSIVIEHGNNGDVYGNKEDSNSNANFIVTGRVEMTGGIVTGRIYGGYSYRYGYEVSGSTVRITGGEVTRDVYGGYSKQHTATRNKVTITDRGKVNGNVYGGWSDEKSATYLATYNTVEISSGEVTGDVYGGYSSGYSGEVSDNMVTITSGSTVKGSVYGGYSSSNAKVSNNTVTINGGTVGTEDSSSIVYGGYSSSGEVSGNTVELLGSADVSEASLYGRNDDASTGYDGNTLLINGWSGSAKSVKNFDEVTFQNIQWQAGSTVLDITNAGNDRELSGTSINVKNLVLANGTHVRAGDKMTFIQSKWDTGLSLEKVNVTEGVSFAQGVATVGELEMKLEGGTNNLVGEIKGVGINPQTDLIAENRAVAAAFVNQGADIAADSLRLLDDGYHFGTQTFGAVYGNRSQYDVNSDIKINGWSEIAGFGNIHEVKGGRLAWGVFYENGTGNYRTWNTFNNEMFRGDGSLLYNGGGAAIRLTKDSGMYYEASLRAGTLSSSMSNAVKDGNGNSYGFDSDSTYWGAHIGAGKLIQRGSGQWDIYGKYFHTDIDGDSFEMGGDRFSFDSVTSDRLRLGARYTADTDKAWSLYCGAAYEYEFSGGSHMKAGQFDAPEQSLQGSTVFGEIGTVWGRKDSPWSMDVNLRGYAGEREGFSGMVQLAYAF